MTKKSHALHRVDGKGGNYTLLPHVLLESAAYRTSSYRARAALTAIAARFNGFNNGRICISSEELADALGNQNYTGNSKAIGELIARGIISLERVWPRGTRKSSEYRLTFVSSGPEGKVKQATNEYLAWCDGDIGSRNKRVVGQKRLATIATETPVSSATIATERNPSSATVATEEKPIDANQPIFPKPSFANIAGHIVSHRGRVANPSADCLKTAGGPRQMKTGVVSAAPEADDLRVRARAFILKHGRGAQRQLATQAGILGGTFSKFLNTSGPLNEQARVRLASAFFRAEVALTEKAA